MSLFLSRQFYTQSSGAGPSEMVYQWISSCRGFPIFRTLFIPIPYITLAPSPGPSIVGTPSHPSHTGADQNDRLPPGQTNFHCIIGSQPKWWASIVSSGVSPNDVRLTARPAPARLGWPWLVKHASTPPSGPRRAGLHWYSKLASTLLSGTHVAGLAWLVKHAPVWLA